MEPGLIQKKHHIDRVTYAAYRFEEENPSKPTLILLHGFLGSAEVFQPLIRRLKGICNVLLIDLMGHGETQAPNDPKRFHANRQIADLKALIKTLCSTTPFLYGYSMGGRLALRYAIHDPVSIRGLILESTSPGIDGLGLLRDRLHKDQHRAADILRDFPSFLRLWNRQPMFTGGMPSAEDLERYMDIQARQDPVGIANSLLGFSPALAPSMTNQLPSLYIPVGLIAGGYDAAYVRHAHEMAKILPQNEIHILAKAAHRVHLDAPTEVADIVKNFILTISEQK